MTTRDDTNWLLFGKYRGTVVESRDPEERGRIEVMVPAVMGEQPIWAMPCVPYAGKDVGLYTIPAPGTGVWIEFEGGDPSFPIWVGCFWHDKEIPAADAKPEIKFLRTERVEVRIDDQAGEVVIGVIGGARFRISANELEQIGKNIRSKADGKNTELTTVAFGVNDDTLRVS